jgi:hypothetical protein
MGKIFTAIWGYFKSMNSEPKGGISIKRNMATAVCLLLMAVEVMAVVWAYQVVKNNVTYLDKFIYLCLFLAVLDAVMILLVLQITSVEKLKDIALQLKAGIMGGAAPASKKEEEPQQQS